MDPLRSITSRRVEEKPWPKSIIVTKPEIDMELEIQQGAHDVKNAGRSLPKVKLGSSVLAHFPIRSVDQITGKALVGWIAYMERNRHQALRQAGFHWKTLYERIVHGPGLTTEDLTREALTYAESSDVEPQWPGDVVYEPVVPAYAALTLHSSTMCTPLQKVVRCVDKILSSETGTGAGRSG